MQLALHASITNLSRPRTFKMNFIASTFVVAVVSTLLGNASTGLSLAWPEGSVGIKFLLTVNDTWDPSGCIATVPTPLVTNGQKSASVQVGSCDYGPLEFTVLNGSHDGVSKMDVYITFHSSVIEDASPPTCTIPWNGSYLNPTSDDPTESPLPSCWTADSREGYHMTYYWMRLLEWQFFN